MRAGVKKYGLIGAVILTTLGVLGLALYLFAQSLTAQALQNQLRQNGFATATVQYVRLYLDGIVIGQINLDAQTELHDVFTPQSPPDLARHGLQHVIVKRWQQDIVSLDGLRWPWPQLQDLSVEDIHLKLHVPQQDINVSGTLKSLQPDDTHLVLLLPFENTDPHNSLTGKLEIDLEKGKLSSIDVNLDDSTTHTSTLTLKRLSGWLNAHYTDGQPPQIQAQFMAGSVLYDALPFADGMVQYSRDATTPAQWTVTLNRAADQYFNTWVIKPATRGRYVLQVASQQGPKHKSAVMISAAPLRLEPLLPETKRAAP